MEQEVISIIIGAAISINALVLFVTALLSYRKYKNSKLLFIIGVFLLFFLRGVLFSLGMFYEPLRFMTTAYYPWVIDIVILNLLYLAALKR